MTSASETSDPWAAWVLATCASQVPELLAVRDRLLDQAKVDARTTVLDLGTGEGLVGTGALQRGASVIFSDISPRLLEECERRVGDSDRQRAHFLLASADHLSALADNSVDVVTSRSVLIYLDDIPAAVDEAFRVLRPEGRLSLFEPVNSFAVDSRIGDFCGYDLRAIADLADRVRAAWTRSRSLVAFDERSLLRDVIDTGFVDVRGTLEIELVNDSWLKGPWEAALRCRPNPLAIPLGDAIDETLNQHERARFEGELRPLIESGKARALQAGFYLVARKGTAGDLSDPGGLEAPREAST